LSDRCGYDRNCLSGPIQKIVSARPLKVNINKTGAHNMPFGVYDGIFRRNAGWKAGHDPSDLLPFDGEATLSENSMGRIKLSVFNIYHVRESVLGG